MRAANLATLGLAPGATAKQIKRAYKRLSAKYAPKRLLLEAMPDAEHSRIASLKARLDDAYEALTERENLHPYDKAQLNNL